MKNQDRCGLYSLLLNGKVVYIGKSRRNLNTRPLDHKATKLFDSYEVVDIPANKLDVLEKNMIEKYQPVLNIEFTNHGFTGHRGLIETGIITEQEWLERVAELHNMTGVINVNSNTLRATKLGEYKKHLQVMKVRYDKEDKATRGMGVETRKFRLQEFRLPMNSGEGFVMVDENEDAVGYYPNARVLQEVFGRDSKSFIPKQCKEPWRITYGTRFRFASNHSEQWGVPMEEIKNLPSIGL